MKRPTFWNKEYTCVDNQNQPNNRMNIHEMISKNFPTNGSLVIFLLYMGMFVAQVRNQLFTTIKPYFYGKT